ncbi:phosphotransferase [Cellulomonas sp.]|uniref:phosphotransferase n=1 Tax=Cellulomonas sp. TaxID=40001 RepID=UPI0025875FF9|nr:phosphotransferase [Cellulomonas sp.]MCR6688803.1 phosphotransferase [Cellulomonas sp.]
MASEITAELIRDLVREQHPDLADLPLVEVDGGWGNQMWRLGTDLAVRIQRMDSSPDHQLKERRWLPFLAPLLPLPVPVPVRHGAPSARSAKLWTVVTWVPGEPLDRATITRAAHATDALAAFLRALHVEAPADAPAGVDRGAHPRECTGGFTHFLESVDPAALGCAARDVRAVWEDAVAAPAWQGPPVWVHGDLHPANVVVADGTLAGVVDFGDLFAGDPAWDLAAAWLLLPAGSSARFFDGYSRADDATIRRARGLAALKSLFLILMGQNGERGLPGGSRRGVRRDVPRSPGSSVIGPESARAALARPTVLAQRPGAGVSDDTQYGEPAHARSASSMPSGPMSWSNPGSSSCRTCARRRVTRQPSTNRASSRPYQSSSRACSSEAIACSEARTRSISRNASSAS